MRHEACLATGKFKGRYAGEGTGDDRDRDGNQSGRVLSRGEIILSRTPRSLQSAGYGNRAPDCFVASRGERALK